MGVRDMSTIDTSPNKVPVQTSICGYDERIIRSAIERELKRGGQVFSYNRVQTIEKIKENLNKLIPMPRLSLATGKWKRTSLRMS